jgi:hypothetical protein
MKHIISVAAGVAVLIIAAPVWAQNPSGGNSMGTPGPNPGGPGLTPYSGGAPPAPMPAMPPTAAEAPPPASAAMHHARAMHHFHHHMAQKAALSGDTTAQLNRQELARIQTGNTGGAPPNPPMPGK